MFYKYKYKYKYENNGSYENNFRECGTLNAVCEEIIKLHIFIELRSSFISEDAAVCFAISLV